MYIMYVTDAMHADVLNPFQSTSACFDLVPFPNVLFSNAEP